MARRVSTGVAVVVTALVVAGVAQASPTTVLTRAASTASLTQAESSLLSAMNSARLTHGLRPLRADFRLERAARWHSSQMLHSGSFSHGAFAVRIRSVGVRAPRIGENLAWGSGSFRAAATMVRMWLASPEHRANLLRPGYRLVGVGALRGTFDGQRNALMVTTDFAGR